MATSWQPAAVAVPCTAAITGFGQATIACIMARAARHRLGVEGETLVGIGAVSGQLLQVVAGAEHGAVGRQHDGRDGAVGGEAREARVQPVDHVERQGVARIGPIHSDERDARLRPIDEKQRVGADLGFGCHYRAVLHQLASSPAVRSECYSRLLQSLFDFCPVRL